MSVTNERPTSVLDRGANTCPTPAEPEFVFHDKERTIAIHRFDLPQPWINYLSNGRLHSLVSQAGGGFAWWKSSITGRLTRYRAYQMPQDGPGFYLYVREADGTIWSPTFRPCETKVDTRKATHGPGFSEFVASRGDWTVRLRIFVAPDYDTQLWDVSVRNDASETGTLDLFAYVEFSQLNWEKELKGGYYVQHMMKGWRDATTQAVCFLDHDWEPYFGKKPLSYFFASEPTESYCASRDDFFGPYQSEGAPRSVKDGRCPDRDLSSGQGCGALHVKVSVPGRKEKALHFGLGILEGVNHSLSIARDKLAGIVGSLKERRTLEEEWRKLRKWWEQHFAPFQCVLPDPVVERQVNTWNPLNTVQTARFSRATNVWAPGTRGIGFRDTAQDLIAIAYRKPDWAISGLLLLLEHQFDEGYTAHTLFPHDYRPPELSLRSDNHLWLPLLVYAILAETGDLRLLARKIPFLAAEGHGKGPTASVWRHLMMAVEFTERHLGVHGIPLILVSDWNDLIGKFSREGRGESVFVGMQYVHALRLLLEISEMMGDTEYGSWLQECLDRQLVALERVAWDGAWWRRGFDDAGAPIGSAQGDPDRIFLNPQSWAVIAGVGSPQQQREGLDAAAQRLDIGYGLKILDPAFAGWDGGDTLVGYGPGCGENGAVFCHANTWAIMAEVLSGNGSRAWKYFNQMMPQNLVSRLGIDTYRAEPYAWVSNIVGPGNTRQGWGNVEQISGTAAWMDLVSTQYLLGIRPRLKGLQIDPCLPKDWEVVEICRHYRDCQLRFRVDNRAGVGRGVKRISIDGEEIAPEGGQMLVTELYLQGRDRAQVEVILG